MEVGDSELLEWNDDDGVDGVVVGGGLIGVERIAAAVGHGLGVARSRLGDHEGVIEALEPSRIEAEAVGGAPTRLHVGGAHARADAQRDERGVEITALQFVQNGAEDHGTGRAQRMAHGNRAVMLYIVQRGDCASFSIADDIDPAYAQSFAQATANGVEAICYDCNMSIDGIEISGQIPILR